VSGEGLKDREVGYGRPPKATRFVPGRSGNPRGRPPGVKSLSDIVRKIVGQKVTVTENGRVRRIPRLEAILLRAAGEATRGDARALRLLLQLTERYGESAQTGAEYEMTGAEDLAILRRYLPDFDGPSPTGKVPETDTVAKRER
jgi:Family of unknown function (DUF5681)